MTTQPARAEPLIEVDELVEALAGSRPPVLLDITFNLGGPPGRLAYQRGHLPGAHFVDLETVLAAPPGPGGRHPLADPATTQQALRTAGIHQDSAVVVYDAGNALAAARGWWVLQAAGIDDVRVLDGGLRAWRAAGQPITAEVPAPGNGTVELRPGQLPMLTAEAAAELAGSGLLIDSRTPERFAGDSEPIDAVAGHIPGAVNVPMADLVGSDGRLRPAAELRERFARAGVRPGAAVGSYVGSYCGSGITAAHTALALAVIGVDAAVYVGSWSHWITDPRRPVATGA